MTNLVLHSPEAKGDPFQLSVEIAHLETLIVERQREFAERQDELREFRIRYTETIGSRLAELADVERAIREREDSLTKGGAATEDTHVSEDDMSAATILPTERGLRKLFWSIAKMFHPDRATDEREAERRHAIMAEASRAYAEGDAERLSVMLGDNELQLLCAATHRADDERDLAARLVNVKEELRTLEFGIRRIKQDGLYKLKMSVDEDAARGRDALSEKAARIRKQIAQARLKLEQLT